MKLSEYATSDATGLADLVRRGEVGAAELRDCAARASAALNPALNAVIELFEDRVANGDAEANPAGPFGGVPFFLKDIGACEKGRLSEMGSRLFAGYRADKTSFLAQRFKRAGLVNLGRTTTPEVGFAGTTESLATGRTANPWNTSRSTGGSSGGAAAVVAAGIAPVAHGSDGAGSIRIPASLCGLVGLKPSRGRVSFGPDFDEPQLGCAGEFVLARTVRDVAAMLDAVSGPCPGDPFVVRTPRASFASLLSSPAAPLRIAWTTRNWATGDMVGGALADAVTQTLRCLEARGHAIEEASPAFDAELAYGANRLAFDSTLLLLEPMAAALGRPIDETTMEPVVLDAWRRMSAMSAREFFVGTLQFNLARRQIGAFFEHHDVLVTPTLAVEELGFGQLDCSSFETVRAFREASERSVFTFTAPLNVTGQPAISLPLGTTAAGTPVGVQLIARSGEEDVLLALAAALEEDLPWAARVPPVHASRV